MKRLWQHDRLGSGITRTFGTDGMVTVRRQNGGTVNVTVRRAMPFSENSVVYMITHTRTFGQQR